MVRILLLLSPFSRIARIPALFFISLWFIIQIFGGVMSLGSTSESGWVAYWAHVGGFLAGLALASVYKLNNEKTAFLIRGGRGDGWGKAMIGCDFKMAVHASAEDCPER